MDDLLVAEGSDATRGRVSDRTSGRDDSTLPLGQIDPAARSACAHALAGAGESLANWWLDNPRQPKERVAELFMVLADAVTAPGGRSRVPGLSGRLGDERSKVRREV